MDPLALFGISVVCSFVAWGIVVARYLWPWLQRVGRLEAMRVVLTIHAFRFVGLAFLIPGVVAPELPAAFARPAAYGDLLASLLAIAALATLRGPVGILMVWIFNLWGTVDLLFAFYQGLVGVGVEPGLLGAAFFIPTVVVPFLLITHGLVFALLLRHGPTETIGSEGTRA